MREKREHKKDSNEARYLKKEQVMKRVERIILILTLWHFLFLCIAQYVNLSAGGESVTRLTKYEGVEQIDEQEKTTRR
ncbi:YpfB family protein [Bacillaceae bacterium SIJ1]|uniref:DUF5359 family protein n=1 Tax=Litoribacterium kuwaitense TaxID=1398745 RepID=UPI0013ED16C1|nr:DUF5359 family protein [Litoribacterium kuwaitense]NGP43690.1 YpfB family protein [Litoribacterium kuwaitense]